MSERNCHFMFIKNDKLKAVYSNDLPAFLTKLGLDKDFQSGLIRCRYCDDVITEKNLFALVPINGKTEFCCTKASCMAKLTEEAGQQ